jgi:hypothetical protein
LAQDRSKAEEQEKSAIALRRLQDMLYAS